MKGMLIDSNVILDIFEDDPVWGAWSEAQLEYFSAFEPLGSNFIEKH